MTARRAPRTLHRRSRPPAVAPSRRAADVARLDGMAVMAAALGHAVNNVLAAILVRAEVVLADAPAEPSIRENVAAVEAAAEQGMRLIARVRELARLTRPFVMRPVSLAAVVVEALAGLAERVGTDCAVAVETRAPLPTVPGERAVLTLAVRHLIANALDATPPGGRIRVVTAVDRDSVSCRVIDTGPGVAADIRPRVFEPFASTRREPGRGLGLTVARAVAARHGGDVELAAAPGGGTIATLRVPRTR